MAARKKTVSKSKSKSKRIRPSWDEYFMEIMEAVSKRGTCDRGYAATVIVKDKRILSTGYVGSAIGSPHCDDVGHDLHEVIGADGKKTKHCTRTTHSEQNAIAQAAKLGISIDGATLYTRFVPCYVCAKMVINAGIVRVVCLRNYHTGDKSLEAFKLADVTIDVLTDEMQTYDDM